MRGALLGVWASIVLTLSCSGSGSGKATHIPISHRASSAVCPQDRGPGVSDVGTACLQRSPPVACARDSDCAGGANGRCLQAGGPACSYTGSYDDCTHDSECTGNAPCACRSSSSDTASNACATGRNCRLDSDCGSVGFCSPSLVGSACQCFSETFCQADAGSGCSVTGADGVTKTVPCSCGGDCGHGYFCHTPKDSCVDDNDCPGGACNFDLTSQAWVCTSQICPT
jgi:hypothetical protein